jgi:hypothetical protein
MTEANDSSNAGGNKKLNGACFSACGGGGEPEIEEAIIKNRVYTFADIASQPNIDGAKGVNDACAEIWDLYR